MCLCGLSELDLKVAHGELVGMRMLLEDVLLSSHHVTMEDPSTQQATLDKHSQILLVNSLRNRPGLYCIKGPSSLESESHRRCPTVSPNGPQD